jgi:Na+/H+ antiporter NhaC
VRAVVGKLIVGVSIAALLWLTMIQFPRGHAQELVNGDGVKDIQIEVDGRIVRGRAYKTPLKITVLGHDGKPLESFKGPIKLSSGGAPVSEALPAPSKGVYTIGQWQAFGEDITVEYKSRIFTKTLTVASWLCLLPPLIAIGLALWSRQVLIALFGGVWLGNATLTLTTPGSTFGNFSFDGFGFMSTFTETIKGEIVDGDHAKVILFTLLMGGMVGIIAASGAMKAIVDIVAKKAKTARSAQFATSIMGVLIFFDDYANTILVGNTMRPFTDRFRISREKLAYIVDSTAAPVAALFLVSTWIGYEVGLIGDMMEAGNIKGVAYNTFLRSIPFRFYSLFGLLMVFVVALSGRDFGPMLKAEQRARHEGKVLADGASPLMDENAMSEFETKRPGTWWLAAGPIVSLVAAILFFLVATGWGPARSSGQERLEQAAAVVGVTVANYDSFPKLWTAVSNEKLNAGLNPEQAEKWQELLAQADFLRGPAGILSQAGAYDALVWGAGVGCFMAILLCMGGGFLNLEDTMKAFVNGLRSMLLAVVVLVLAWSLGQVCKDLATGEWLAEILKGIKPALLPTLVFLLSASIAFATGTSWGTMAIVFPILGPLLGQQMGTEAFDGIMLGSVGAVLAGSCFGDHSSPISDTTVLSSMASGSDHIDHVRTQIPYAFYCGSIAIVFGFLPAGFGLSPWIGLVVGSALLIAGVMVFGKRAEDPIDGHELTKGKPGAA